MRTFLAYSFNFERRYLLNLVEITEGTEHSGWISRVGIIHRFYKNSLTSGRLQYDDDTYSRLYLTGNTLDFKKIMVVKVWSTFYHIASAWFGCTRTIVWTYFRELHKIDIERMADSIWHGAIHGPIGKKKRLRLKRDLEDHKEEFRSWLREESEYYVDMRR